MQNEDIAINSVTHSPAQNRCGPANTGLFTVAAKPFRFGQGVVFPGVTNRSAGAEWGVVMKVLWIVLCGIVVGLWH